MTPMVKPLRRTHDRASILVADLATEVLSVLTSPETIERLRARIQHAGERVLYDPHLVLGVFADDPPELVEAVYRAKASVLHPDNRATGNAGAFKAVNTAYTEILRRRASNGTRTDQSGAPADHAD